MPAWFQINVSPIPSYRQRGDYGDRTLSSRFTAWRSTNKLVATVLLSCSSEPQFQRSKRRVLPLDEGKRSRPGGTILEPLRDGFTATGMFIALDIFILGCVPRVRQFSQIVKEMLKHQHSIRTESNSLSSALFGGGLQNADILICKNDAICGYCADDRQRYSLCAISFLSDSSRRDLVRPLIDGEPAFRRICETIESAQ